MGFNVGLAMEALDYAAQSPELWLRDSAHWAVEREDGLTVTGLAGHVAIVSGADFWYRPGCKETNWLERASVPERFHRDIQEYVERKHLGWPEEACSIFLAARLLLDLGEGEGLALLANNDTIEGTRARVSALAAALS